MRITAKKPEISRQEFNSMLEDAQLSLADLARLVGVAEKTPQRWAAGDNIPLSVLIVLKLLQKRPELKPLIESISEEF